MIDYLSIARVATHRWCGYSSAHKEEMVGCILLAFAKYLHKPNPVIVPEMFNVIAQRAVIRWAVSNRRNANQQQTLPIKDEEGRLVDYFSQIVGEKNIEMPDEFETLISRLHPRHKLIMRLYYSDNYSFDKIGELLEISGQAVHTAHNRAIDKLRRTFGHD